MRALLLAVLLMASTLWSVAVALAQNPDGVAVIIGNKNYAEGVPAVDFAHNDADAMKRFVIDVLGFREGNIIDLRDATQAQLFSAFGSPTDHRGKLWSWARSGESNIVVFYSGHGVPGQRDRKGYLLPVDADPDTPEINGYSLDALYSNLAQIGARSITVYLDACFSGESPRGMLIRSASTIIGRSTLPKGVKGLTVITAAAGDQLASWDEEAKHGLFTRYLIETLYGKADAEQYGNGDGEVTVAEVKNYLDRELTYAARRNYRREQHASVQGDDGLVLAARYGQAHQILKQERVENESSGSELNSDGQQQTVALEPLGFMVLETDQTMVALKNANVRAGPSTEEMKVGTLRTSHSVKVTGKVKGRDWYRVALANGGSGFVWSPLLGEETITQVEPVDLAPDKTATTGKLAPPPQAADPSEIIIAAGPLSGLPLTDWLLLSGDRLKDGRYAELIEEAVNLRDQRGAIAEVKMVLQQAIMGDLRGRRGMEGLVYATAYRRQHGSFGVLENYLDEAVNGTLSMFEPVTSNNANAALEVLKKLKPISGTTPRMLSIEARAYHVLEEYKKAGLTYGAWLNAAPPADAERKYMIEAMLRAQRAEPYGPQVGKSFRDCPKCPEMVEIPAGSFMMGPPTSELIRTDHIGPQHRVTFSAPFAVGKYEVTFSEWDECVLAGGCPNVPVRITAYPREDQGEDEGWGRRNRPAINVNWDDAQRYVQWISHKTGKRYRLLSEAQWEYAARGGISTARPWHAVPINGARWYFPEPRDHLMHQTMANCPGCGSQWDSERTAPVGSFPANGFGTHDMLGNVLEWTEDCWNGDGYNSPAGLAGVAWTEGDCSRHILRGGSWHGLQGVKPFYRSSFYSDYRFDYIGFRVTRAIP